MISERFCSFLADTTDAQHIHHYLRYKVYCERKHYEDGMILAHRPQERDEYDARAARFIVHDRKLDDWIGTARLVPNDTQLLPAQQLGAVDNHHNHLLANHACAEVSRLATTCAFTSVNIRTELLRTIILSVLGESRKRDIEWLVFLVSPGLARVLDRLGVPMEACGPEICHRGARRAYRSHIEHGINQVAWAQCLRSEQAGYELFSGQQIAAA